jgi:hypothetical protein
MRTALLCIWFVTLPGLAQNIDPAHKANAPVAPSAPTTNQFDHFQAAEAVRTNCIQGRRIICGKILKVLPGGLVVDSGYTSLMRHPLDRNWLIPGTVEAEREPNLVEKNEPDCVCVGLVFLTDIPKSSKVKPKVLDYVVLHAFPTGHVTYTSVGSIQRTVRRFSGSLPTAVQLNLNAGQK